MERDGPLMEGRKRSMITPDSCVDAEGTIQGNRVCGVRVRNVTDISRKGQQKKPKLRDRNQTKCHCTMTDRQDKMRTVAVAAEMGAELQGTFGGKNRQNLVTERWRAREKPGWHLTIWDDLVCRGLSCLSLSG